MAEIIVIYKNIILEFLLELYVFYALTTRKLDRAPRFWLRVLGGLGAVLAIAFGAAFFYRSFGETALGRIAIYITLFAVTAAHIRLCFDETFPTVLFCCNVAYAAQNLCYKLYLILWCGGEALHLYDGWGRHFDLYYRVMYYAFFVLALLAVYFLFIRGLLRHLSSRHLDHQMFVISIMVLSITVILCSVEDVYFGHLSVGRENQFELLEHFVLRQTGNLFSVVCCAIVLLLTSRTIEQRELRQEVEYLQHAVHQSELQYEISKDTIDLINIKCHDIRYKLGTLAARGEQMRPETVADLQQSISIYDAKMETGNQLLDVLLTEKSLYCEQNGITFSCMADGAKLIFMDDGDLYCLFGNIIDNALEAVKAIGERQRRVVNLVVKARGDMLIIQSDNYFDGERTFRDGLPVTTKTDQNYHGFGMRSIRMIVHKYEGELTAYTTDDVFHLNILFSSARE